MNNSNRLLESYYLNSLFTLKNRIVMAPMTRAKASDDLVPTAAMANYYARRTDAGLIITEGTVIRADAAGHCNVPGIFNQTQIKHWQQVTEQVHQRDGLIFMQLWHVGRVSHPQFLQGQLPISASATKMTGKLSRSDLAFGMSRAATITEIQELIDSYAIAATNALIAGFDGVEIHGANGYLIDQFLHYHTNQREDDYGGSSENMARFALAIATACGDAIGYQRVGIRLSPGGYLNEIVGDDKDAMVFEYLLNQLNHFPIAYVHTGNFNDAQKFKELYNLSMSEFIRKYYRGTVIGCGSYSLDAALNQIIANNFDLISIGRPFIANHDLIKRLHNQQHLQPYDASMLNTLY